jgi:hypothetical protein
MEALRPIGMLRLTVVDMLGLAAPEMLALTSIGILLYIPTEMLGLAAAEIFTMVEIGLPALKVAERLGFTAIETLVLAEIGIPTLTIAEMLGVTAAMTLMDALTADKLIVRIETVVDNLGMDIADSSEISADDVADDGGAAPKLERICIVDCGVAGDCVAESGAIEDWADNDGLPVLDRRGLSMVGTEKTKLELAELCTEDNRVIGVAAVCRVKVHLSHGPNMLRLLRHN